MKILLGENRSNSSGEAAGMMRKLTHISSGDISIRLPVNDVAMSLSTVSVVAKRLCIHACILKNNDVSMISRGSMGFT